MVKTKEKYKWDISSPPKLDRHSEIKHKMLKEYIISYIEILSASPYSKKLHLNIVDGFCGGGTYISKLSNGLVLGSPLTVLEAIREGEAIVNLKRKEANIKTGDPYRVIPKIYFVDSDKSAIDALKYNINEMGYSMYNDCINVVHANFSDVAAKILQEIINSRNRAIFILDQFGYSDAKLNIIANIFTHINKPEVFLTFTKDAFLAYLNDSDTFIKAMENIGISPERIISLLKCKTSPEYIFRAENIMETKLAYIIAETCKARYFTPFFIRSTEGTWGYWLIHLSNHWKARDAMTSVHWQNQNFVAHYGNCGLNMLAYNPRDDEALTRAPLLFNVDDREKSINTIVGDIPDELKITGDICFSNLMERVVNRTPADMGMIKQALDPLLVDRDIEIRTKEGGYRKKSSRIKLDDTIIRSNQTRLIFK